MNPLRIFIGYDSHEPIAYHVLAHSILTRASVPVSITPLVQDTLRKQGLYTRERNPLESTEFSLTRFLVPYLSDYEGWSVFMDCDMLCLADVDELRDLCFTDESVVVVQHDYVPRANAKFLGHKQSTYPRKNWSSVMAFNNSKCRELLPEYINSATGLDLHRLNWARSVGPLPLKWNYLVGEDRQALGMPKILHYTNGGPWFDEYKNCDHADLWFAERDAMLRCKQVVTA